MVREKTEHQWEGSGDVVGAGKFLISNFPAVISLTISPSISVCDQCLDVPSYEFCMS